MFIHYNNIVRLRTVYKLPKTKSRFKSLCKGVNKMRLSYFKDLLFEMLNESEEMNVPEIKTGDENNLFQVLIVDGSEFEIKCRKLE